MFRTMPARIAVAALALGSLAWQGCTTDSMITAPGADRSGFTTDVRRMPVSDGTWTVIASQKIEPGNEATISGSRYTLVFSKNAIHNAMTITMSERDHGLVDVKLDPDGTVFEGPVTLKIDYTGTYNDPDSPYYTGLSPRVGRYNPATRAWDILSGSDDPATRTYTVALIGFSRYAMNDGMQPGSTSSDPDHTSLIQ